MRVMEVFVVRLWPERPELHGRVEHVGSGSASAFAGGDALIQFLGEHLPDDAAVGDKRESPAPRH